jgi:hypothetical protein
VGKLSVFRSPIFGNWEEQHFQPIRNKEANGDIVKQILIGYGVLENGGDSFFSNSNKKQDPEKLFHIYNTTENSIHTTWVRKGNMECKLSVSVV